MPPRHATRSLRRSLPPLRLAVVCAIAVGWGCRPGPELATAEIDVVAYLTDAPSYAWDAEDLTPSMTKNGVDDVRFTQDGRPFRWLTERRARLVLDVPTPGWPYDLVVDARRYEHASARPQTVSAIVNGVRFPAAPLDQREVALRWSLPAGTLKAGANVIVLETDPLVVPAEVRDDVKDQRSLAFRLMGIALTPHRTPDADPDTLVVLAGEEVRVPFVAMQDPTLALEALEVFGTGDTVLDVSLHLDGGGPLDRSLVHVAALGPGDTSGARAFDLDVAEGVGATLVIGLSTTEGGRAKLKAPVLTTRYPRYETPIAPPFVPPKGTRPNLVMYVVDTTRADRIGAIGYDRPTTPFLASLVREEGAQAYVAESNSPWTRPSVGTLLTGLEQGAHGVVFDDSGLPPDIPTMPQALHDAGYYTVGIAANPHVSRASGFDRGFELFVEKAGSGRFKSIKKDRDGLERPDVHDIGKARVEYYIDDVVAAIAAAPPDRPLFLYVHSMAAHAPYQPPKTAQALMGEVRLPTLGGEPLDTTPLQMGWINDVTHERIPIDHTVTAGLSYLYDAEIRAEEEFVARVVDALRASGRWDDTLMLYTSDHGEQFGDHGGLNHTRHLYREYLEVPFVIRYPSAWRVPRTVQPSLLDVAPTFLAAAGLPPFAVTQGRSLLSGAAPPRRRFAQTHAFEQYALWDDDFKLVVRKAAPAGVELYDLRADPGEQHEIAHLHPARVALMRQAVEDHIAANATLRDGWTARTTEFTPAQLQELEALGYVQGPK